MESLHLRFDSEGAMLYKKGGMNIAQLNTGGELFYSLQGEGARAGSPAVFLRLAGCNLHCSWCDTKHSWGRGIAMAEAELAAKILSYACPGLVITGGEPLLQAAAIEELLNLLPGSLYVEIETNGTIAPTPALAKRVNQWNVSPKLAHAGNGGAAIVPQALAAFCATRRAWFKFVVQGESDWEAIAALALPRECTILMPCATTKEQLETARPAVVQMCLQHRVRFGDRLHVALWGDKKGV